jgi:hypothetical protein
MVGSSWVHGGTLARSPPHTAHCLLTSHRLVLLDAEAAGADLSMCIPLAMAHVSRAFPFWNRFILTEIYILCHACSYQFRN